MRNTHGCPRFVWYSWMGVVTPSTLTFRATTPDTRPASVQCTMRETRHPSALPVMQHAHKWPTASDAPSPAPPPVGGKPIRVPVHDLKYTCSPTVSHTFGPCRK